MNRRAIFAMRSIGCDRAESQTFCGIIDLPTPHPTSSRERFIQTDQQKNWEGIQGCSRPINKESEQGKQSIYLQKKQDEIRNIDASSDGTWITPGHSSKGGAPNTIGCATGNVLFADT